MPNPLFGSEDAVAGIAKAGNNVGVVVEAIVDRARVDDQIVVGGKKSLDALGRRKVVNGHAIGRMGQELNVYASAGISDDHECVTEEELLARLRAGMKVLVREGSTERNLDRLIRGAIKANAPLENLCFCTDDKHLADIRREGTIRQNLRLAVSLGMNPVEAVQMATVNAARIYRLEARRRRPEFLPEKGHIHYYGRKSEK